MNILQQIKKWLRIPEKIDYNSSWFVTLVLFHHKHRRKILLPKNLDLEAHIKQFPPTDYGYKSNLRFNIGKLYYFLSLLSSIPARNKDLINDDGWVPVSMSILRNNIKDIVWYKDYLISTGIIECDNLYIPGEKAFWYRWSSKYSPEEFELQNVSCPHEDKAYFSLEDDDAEIKSYPYLSYWYENKGLEVDSKIHSYSRNIYKAKVGGLIDLSINPTTHKKKDPKEQYKASSVNIDKISNHVYEVHIDTTVHRLHSVITNMESDYRNFLTYRGSELINIDINNSQPYLACLLLNHLFWESNSHLPINLYMLPQNIQDSLCHEEVLSEIKRFFSTHSSSNFQTYIQTVASGQFYETFANIAKSKLDKNITRKEAKTLMFYVLFSSNQGQHDNPTINALRELFTNEIYPSVAELFKIIKRRHKSIKSEKQHNRLACLLQSIESEIILHRCCKRIWAEGNHQIPVFTIHDSMATTVANEAFVKRIMTEELSKCIGIAPSIDAEIWSVNYIKYPDLLKT